MAQTKRLDVIIGGDSKGAQKAVGETEDAFGGIAGKLEAAGVGVAAAGLTVGVMAGAALTKAFMDNLEFEKANDLLAAQMGIFNEEGAEDLGRIAGEVYTDAFGESLPQVNESIKAAFQSGLLPEDAADEDIKSMTEKLLNFTTTFGGEANEVARSVGQMLRTGMVESADEGFDVLTRGFQQTGDTSEDLLDTFNEYGTQFRKLGLDGETAMGLINQAVHAGARDTDVAADSLKEFSIRAVDASDSTKNAFTILGLNANDMMQTIAKGGPGATMALGDTLAKLRAMEDPVARNTVGVALFGTQWEDMGDALLAMDPSTAVQGLGDVAGAADKTGDVLNDNLGTQLESIKRKLDPATLLAAFKSGGLEGVKEQLSGAISEIGALWDQYGPQVREALNTAWTFIQGWWAENGPGLMATVEEWWNNTGQPWLSDVLGKALGTAWDAGMAWLKMRVSDPQTWLDALQGTSQILDILLNPFKFFIDWLTNTAPGAIAGAASGMWHGISDAFRSVVNTMIGWWNNLSFDLPSVDLPFVGKVGGFTLDTPNIPTLHSGGVYRAPNGRSEGLALLQSGETVIPRGGSGGAAIEVKVYGNVYGVDNLAEEIRSAWYRKSRTNPFPLAGLA